MAGPDWNRIREEYITTDVGYRKLSEKWNVSFNTLKDRAKREMWFSKREHFRADVRTKTLRVVSDYTIKSGAEKLINLKRAADSLTDLINAVLQDTRQIKRIYIDEDGSPSYRYDIRSIKELVGALKDLTVTVKCLEDTQGAREQSGVIMLPQREDSICE